jgi:hypothetical protein
MLSPTWQALITELASRPEFSAATRLDMVSVNVSRAAGPAIAGFVIAPGASLRSSLSTRLPVACWR